MTLHAEASLALSEISSAQFNAASFKGSVIETPLPSSLKKLRSHSSKLSCATLCLLNSIFTLN